MMRVARHDSRGSAGASQMAHASSEPIARQHVAGYVAAEAALADEAQAA